MALTRCSMGFTLLQSDNSIASFRQRNVNTSDAMSPGSQRTTSRGTGLKLQTTSQMNGTCDSTRGKIPSAPFRSWLKFSLSPEMLQETEARAAYDERIATFR